MSIFSLLAEYTIPLNNGTILHLHSINHDLCYTNILEGRPLETDNRDALNFFILQAFKRHLSGCDQLPDLKNKLLKETVKPNLPILPGLPLTLLPSKRQDCLPGKDGSYPLQPVVCSATFIAFPPDDTTPLSYGAVVWFQSKFEPLISDEAMQQIKFIPWDQASVEYNL